MIGSLQELESLLRKYEQPCLANAVPLALSHASARDERLRRDLCSGDWRGDSDSIAAIEPAIPGGFSRDARADSRRLRERMLIIYAGSPADGQPVQQVADFADSGPVTGE